MKIKIGATIGLAVILGIALMSSYSTSSEVSKVNEVKESSFNDNYRIAMPPIPDTVRFCGELVPQLDTEVKERLEREVLSNTYWQSNTVLMLKRSGKYFPLIERILKEEGLPEDFKYLAVAESGLIQAVSSAGAKGIWQFMNSTAQSYGLTVNSEVDERYHVEKSTRAACAYLKKAKEDLGTWTLAAAAYNRGLAGIKRDVRNQQVTSYYDLYLNTETSRYVFRIIAFKLLMSSPEKYGFVMKTKDYYKPESVILIQVDTTITDLADFAIKNGTNYKTVKVLNPWLRDDHLTVRAGSEYLIKVPR